MREIERTLRRGASAPHIEYNKGKVEEHKLKIQGILSTLGALSSPLDENFNVGGSVPHLVHVDPHGTATTSVSEGGTSLAPRFFLLSQFHSSLWTLDQTHVRSG
jgi:hypothetical protein